MKKINNDLNKNLNSNKSLNNKQQEELKIIESNNENNSKNFFLTSSEDKLNGMNGNNKIEKKSQEEQINEKQTETKIQNNLIKEKSIKTTQNLNTINTTKPETNISFNDFNLNNNKDKSLEFKSLEFCNVKKENDHIYETIGHEIIEKNTKGKESNYTSKVIKNYMLENSNAIESYNKKDKKANEKKNYPLLDSDEKVLSINRINRSQINKTIYKSNKNALLTNNDSKRKFLFSNRKESQDNSKFNISRDYIKSTNKSSTNIISNFNKEVKSNIGIGVECEPEDDLKEKIKRLNADNKFKIEKTYNVEANLGKILNESKKGNFGHSDYINCSDKNEKCSIF